MRPETPASFAGSGASIIVTANVRDFPPEALAPHKITAQKPDPFIRSVLEADPETAIAAFAADRARLLKPPMAQREYLISLERAGLAETVAALRAYEDAL